MFTHPLLNLPKAEITTKSLYKGEGLFHQFDPVKNVYVLHSGRIQLLRNLKNGFRVTLHSAGAGESFAEASLFSEQYHCDAVCTSKALVSQIPKDAVLKHLKNDPEFSFNLLKTASKQVQHYRGRLQIISIKPANERVLAALASGIPYNTITELASSIGLTHEACYRALSRLDVAGKITKIGRGRYVLKAFKS